MQRNEVYQKIKFYVLYLSWKSSSSYATMVYIKMCTYPCPYGLALGDAYLFASHSLAYFAYSYSCAV